MRPDLLRLASIVQKCKFNISANAAHKVISKEGETLSTRLTFAGKPASMGDCLDEIFHIFANQAGIYGKGRLAKS